MGPTFSQAVRFIADRLNVSIGRAQALLRAACAARDIRAFTTCDFHEVSFPVLSSGFESVPASLWSAHAREHLYITDDGFLVDHRPTRVVTHSRERHLVVISSQDLMFWLADRAAPAPKQTPRKRPSAAQVRQFVKSYLETTASPKKSGLWKFARDQEFGATRVTLYAEFDRHIEPARGRPRKSPKKIAGK